MVRLGNDWDDILKGEFDKPYYVQLRQFLIEEYRTNTIYPGMYDIFNALKCTPYSKVKAVIFGQDPYHGEGQAQGLSFSVGAGTLPPPSLVNIFTELESDLGLPRPASGDLHCWAEQGVLLLNTVLTVRAHQPNSHKGKGWEIFTDRVVAELDQKDTPIVFLLWGRNARDKAASVTNPKHVKLCAPHPSPLSAYSGFFGCRCFSKTNEILENAGLTPIDWRVK